MSKYLGKLLLENGIVEDPGEVCVRYKNDKDAFCFRSSNLGCMTIGKELCLELAKFTGMLHFQYKWSTGYVVKEKRPASEMWAMRTEELDCLGGRWYLMMEQEWLASDDDFDLLCVIQYLFQYSETFLRNVMKCWKRYKWGRSESAWVQMTKRVLGKGGRKKGGHNSVTNDTDEKESLEDILSRCEHNKRVAVSRGFYTWYKEACEEEAKALGKKLDKVEMLVQWNKERAKLES